jgi:hypothetical protein
MAMQMSDNGRYDLMDGYVSYGSDSIWSEFWRYPILRSLIALQKSDAIPAGSAAVFAAYGTPGDASSDKKTAASMVRDLHLSAVVVFDSGRHGAAISYLEQVLGWEPTSAGSCSVFQLAQQGALVGRGQGGEE